MRFHGTDSPYWHHHLVIGGNDKERRIGIILNLGADPCVKMMLQGRLGVDMMV